MKEQAEAQVFAKAPGSKGKITAPNAGARWQLDLIDYKGSPDKGNTVALVVIDVFSRELWAEALPSKEPRVVAAAFERILGKGARRRSKGAQAVPNEVSHDAGTEWSGPFKALLEKHGIASTQKTSLNSLAIVDAAINGLKTTMKKELGAGNPSWSSALPKAVAAHNKNSHGGLMGSAPLDVKASPELQYALEAQAGRGVAQNANIHEERVKKLLAAGAFRKLLPRAQWVRAGHPRWSGEVFKVKELVGGVAVATDGSKTAIRDVLPVGEASKSVTLAPRPTRVPTTAAEALKPYAVALEGFLGQGTLTTQGAGTKLRAVPGFSEAMQGNKLTGIGALSRFLALFPGRFAIDGAAPRQRVRRA